MCSVLSRMSMWQSSPQFRLQGLGKGFTTSHGAPMTSILHTTTGCLAGLAMQLSFQPGLWGASCMLEPAVFCPFSACSCRRSRNMLLLPPAKSPAAAPCPKPTWAAGQETHAHIACSEKVIWARLRPPGHVALKYTHMHKLLAEALQATWARHAEFSDMTKPANWGCSAVQNAAFRLDWEDFVEPRLGSCSAKFCFANVVVK